MSNRTVYFTFNTAIIGLDEESGRYDDKALTQAVLPLRGRIMQIDGVCGLYIARYGMRVEYMHEVIELEQLDRKIAKAIDWAAKSEKLQLFPLRGSKTPEASLERPTPPSPTYSDTVTVRFGTNVVAFPPSETEEKIDTAAFNKLTHRLATKLTDTDGVREYQLRLNGAQITFDTRVTTRGYICAHMKEVLKDAVKGNYFPYLDGDSTKLELVFS